MMAKRQPNSKQAQIAAAMAVLEEHFGTFVFAAFNSAGRPTIQVSPMPERNGEALSPRVIALIRALAEHPNSWGNK